MMKRERKDEYKPLLFTTTLRNPERMKEFLSVLAPLNGQLLTSEVIDKIVFELIASKKYIPMYVGRVPRLKSQLCDVDKRFNLEEAKEIIINSPQKHKEAGFECGWPSRFDTWYKFLKELGFVYYEMNKPIEISETGFMLIKAMDNDYRHFEEQIFLNSFVKYQRNNPFRKVSNENKPLILLLQVILELRRHYGNDCAGITTKEVSFILCCKNANAIKITQEIIKIREKYSFSPSDEVLYEVCKSLLGISQGQEKRFKLSNLLYELPDEFIRKMRLTGLITIRGYGRFIDANTLETEKIDYVLKHYSSIMTFASQRQFYDYMKTMDMKLISVQSKAQGDASVNRKAFLSWVDQFEIESLYEEIKIVCSSRAHSKHDIFKYISDPLRLEFLTALALQKKFPNIYIKANYKVDDEGLPSSFAHGGMPDIECIDDKGNVLFEVTLLTGTQQNIREMPAIARHLREALATYTDCFSVMLAPTIHSDTREYAEFIKMKDKIDIIPLSVSDFIKNISQKISIRELRAS